MTIKERLVECYREHGIDFLTACEYATQWIRDLNKEPSGTTWTLGPNRLGHFVTVRRN